MSSSGSAGADPTKAPSEAAGKPKEGTEARSEGGERPSYITEVKSTDILCGRGHKIIQHQGNRDFRDLVSTRKAEYVKTGRYKVKDQIARQIVDEITNRNGRFLRKVSSLDEAKKLGVPKGVEAWVIAEDHISLEKTKQALRDKEPSKTSAIVCEAIDSVNDEVQSPQPNPTEATAAAAAANTSQAQLITAFLNLQSRSMGNSSSWQHAPAENDRKQSHSVESLLLKLQQSQTLQQQQQQLQQPPTTPIGSLASLLLPQRPIVQQSLPSQELMYLQYLEQQKNVVREQQRQQQITLRNMVDTARRQAGIHQLSLDNLISHQLLDLLASRAGATASQQLQNSSLPEQERRTTINPLLLGGPSTLMQTSYPSLPMQLMQGRLSQHVSESIIPNAPQPLISTQQQSSHYGPLNLSISRRLSSSLSGNPLVQSVIGDGQKGITSESKDNLSKDAADNNQEELKSQVDHQSQKRPRAGSH
jgi:hypothetical protein